MHADGIAVNEILELRLRRRGGDLSERHGADETARSIGEIDRAELLLLEGAHFPKRVVDRRLRGERGDARIHQRSRSVEGIREELADLRREPSGEPAQDLLAFADVEARDDRRGARRVHLLERDLGRFHRQVAHDLRRDARIQKLEEVDRGLGTCVVDDERGLAWHALVEKTRDLVGVVAEVLGVQRAAGLELGRGRRLRERKSRLEWYRHDRFAHARSITKKGPSGGF